jgi:DNA-binding transcriptional regulator YdaS (Cro superfamily)
MSNPMAALDRAVREFPTQEAFAAALGVKSPSISEWRSRKAVPADRCAQIEQVTRGVVTRAELRPDLFGEQPKSRKAA